MAQKTAVVRNTLATTASAYTDFTSSGFGTPTAAIIVVCNGNSTNNPQDGALLSVGFWDGTNQNAAALSVTDNVTAMSSFRNSNDAYGVVLPGTPSYYTVSTAPADGIRITMSVDNTNAARYATVLLLNGVSAKVGQIVSNPTQNSAQESGSLGFAPQLVFFTSVGSGTIDTAGNAGLLSFGFAADDATHRAFMFGSTDAAADAQVSQLFSETRAAGQNYADTYTWGGEVTTFGADTFTLTTRDGGSGSDYAFYLALGGADLSFDKGTLTTPTSTSTVATTTAIAPETALLMLGTAAGTAAETDADANGVMIGLADASAEYSHNIYDEDGAATSNTGSVASATTFVDLDTSVAAARSDLVTGTVAFDTDSFDITYSAVSGTARKGWWVAFGAAAGATAYTLDAQPGSFSVTGTAATLARGWNLDAQPGTFAVTGTAATLARGWNLNAATGAFTYTGTAATFDYAQPGAYALDCQPGTFTVSGVAGTLTYVPVTHYSIDAAPGTFTVSGVAGTLTYGQMQAYEVAANAGTFSVSGTVATLDYSGAAVWTDVGVSATTWADVGGATSIWTDI